MINDIPGNPLPNATPEAARLFDAAADAFAVYRGDPIGLLDEALALAPGFSMARLMKAWLLALATEPAAARAAGEIPARLARRPPRRARGIPCRRPRACPRR